VRIRRRRDDSPKGTRVRIRRRRDDSPKGTRVREVAGALCCLVVVLVAAPARAQIRYDLGALATFQQRFLASTQPGASSVAEGGGLTLDGHIAIFPLLRVGAWVTGEVSEPIGGSAAGGGATRELVSTGLRVKMVPPWPRGVWRAWFATGFGVTGVITDEAGGGFFEVPIILGASYRIRKPVVFLMELGARLGFGFWGSYYMSGGTDVVSVALSLGIGVD